MDRWDEICPQFVHHTRLGGLAVDTIGERGHSDKGSQRLCASY